MPRYDYKCLHCDYRCELDHSVEQINSLFFCPKCDSPLKREIQAVPFILKGRGWAKDGYGGGGSSNTGNLSA